MWMIDIGLGIEAALALGFLLGLKHATDADHVVAVATIVGTNRNGIWRGIWIGASWGVGHTLPLLGIGIVFLTMKGRYLSTYEGVAVYFEFIVGLMLAVLGAQVLWNLARRRIHLHEHLDHKRPHVHIHASHSHTTPKSQIVEHGDGGYSHSIWSDMRPTFRLRSFAIGVVHGLAGSAVLMVALLAKIDSTMTGLGYLSLFSIGTILSMALITVALSASFRMAANMAQARMTIIGLAGLSSLVIGGILMAETAVGKAVIPY